MKQPLIPVKELNDFLRAIESGEILLTTPRSPMEVYSGNMTYRASNGWEIVIFNDSGEWDYVDSISTADGRVYRFEDMDGDYLELEDYEPPEEVIEQRYGFQRQPGRRKP
jgi:hypothetical protein